MPLTFGHVPGYPPGATFVDRDSLKAAGLHARPIDGISYLVAEVGADAIVLNGGYPDDDDRGETMTYSGEGGRTGSRRSGDQHWTKGNDALRESWRTGRPIRVVRGPRLRSPFRPAAVYRYDGLYAIQDAQRRPGIDGFQTCLFELVRLPGDEPPWKATAPVVVGKPGAPGQTETVSRRTLRDTRVTRWVKRQHNDACQICGKAGELGKGALYSEGAHIRPLGRPHEGSDSSDNVLCLCPECHVLFDYGVLFITAGGLVFDTREARTVESLRTTVSHHVDPAQLTYHREVIAGQGT